MPPWPPRKSPAVPAVLAFTDIDQRKLIAKMRATYKVALGAENDEEDTKKKAKADQVAEDMENRWIQTSSGRWQAYGPTTGNPPAR